MATVSIRMDDETKLAFESFCQSVGLTISAAVNMFAKITVRENRIPFEIAGEPKISDDPFWQIPENVESLRKSVKQLEEGKCAVHELIGDEN